MHCRNVFLLNINRKDSSLHKTTNYNINSKLTQIFKTFHLVLRFSYRFLHRFTKLTKSTCFYEINAQPLISNKTQNNIFYCAVTLSSHTYFTKQIYQKTFNFKLVIKECLVTHYKRTFSIFISKFYKNKFKQILNKYKDF